MKNDNKEKEKYIPIFNQLIPNKNNVLFKSTSRREKKK